MKHPPNAQNLILDKVVNASLHCHLAQLYALADFSKRNSPIIAQQFNNFQISSVKLFKTPNRLRGITPYGKIGEPYPINVCCKFYLLYFKFLFSTTNRFYRAFVRSASNNLSVYDKYFRLLRLLFFKPLSIIFHSSKG